MPPRISKPCTKPGCSALTLTGGRCPDHVKQQRKQHDQARGTAHARGYGARWQRSRLLFLDDNPLCKHCEADSRTTAATVVDHIKPHKGNHELFWDVDGNWQALCATCHNTKTVTEDGGFGR